MTMGEKIRAYRKERNMTQKELSEATQIAEITIRQYEANKYVPKIDKLEKIAAAFEVPLDDFFNMHVEAQERSDYVLNHSTIRKDGKIGNLVNSDEWMVAMTRDEELYWVVQEAKENLIDVQERGEGRFSHAFEDFSSKIDLLAEKAAKENMQIVIRFREESRTAYFFFEFIK